MRIKEMKERRNIENQEITNMNNAARVIQSCYFSQLTGYFADKLL
jgi:hypothetical protein